MGCRNPECIVNLKEVYDSKKRKNCNVDKINQGKVSLIKYYVKCLYETRLEDDQANIDLRIDYLEFYYLKLNNVFKVTKEIVELERKYLSPFQRLRVTRLKQYMKDESNQFCK